MTRLKIWMKLLYWYICSLKCSRKAKLLSAEETVEEICENPRSLIRLGDGELNCLEGIDVHYQRAEEGLQREMAQLIDLYIKDPVGCGYLLCMPNEFLKCNGLALAKKRVWVASWARFRFVFRKQFDKPIPYGDAFLFARAYAPLYRRIWENAQTVIFVHNDEQYARRFRDRYNKTVKFIGIPARDCYEQIDTIVSQIEEAVESAGDEAQPIVLISAGPCAKAVVFRLRNKGVPIIDTGHCWDDPLHLR